jgi:hypothetical protein
MNYLLLKIKIKGPEQAKKIFFSVNYNARYFSLFLSFSPVECPDDRFILQQATTISCASNLHLTAPKDLPQIHITHTV